MATDTNLNQLVINKLTQEQYNSAKNAGQIVETELYMITDSAGSIPTKTSELENDSGFITSVPVTSVNNKTGEVNLTASDVGAATTAQVETAQNTANEAKTAANNAANAVSAKASTATYTATIGTNWTEDSDTGAKTQNVAISGILASDDGVQVDHYYGEADYAAFVAAENEYLDFIANGYAETYNGGIKFTIFGDANTVGIPIVVKVVR